MVMGGHTSRVKLPDTPHDVVAAGVALVEVGGIETTVCGAGTSLETGTSLDGDDPTVTVTVACVGAKGLLSLEDIKRICDTYLVLAGTVR